MKEKGKAHHSSWSSRDRFILEDHDEWVFEFVNQYHDTICCSQSWRAVIHTACSTSFKKKIIVGHGPHTTWWIDIYFTAYDFLPFIFFSFRSKLGGNRSLCVKKHTPYEVIVSSFYYVGCSWAAFSTFVQHFLTQDKFVSCIEGVRICPLGILLDVVVISCQNYLWVMSLVGVFISCHSSSLRSRREGRKP